MGQLLVKFKKWHAEKHEKAEYVSSQHDDSATGEIDNFCKEDLFKKFKMLECFLENQRKFIEGHDVKLQEIENVLNKILVDKEKIDDETETGSSTNEEGDQAESRDLWKMFECHAQILNGHEEQLESNMTKIEIIREILEHKKGHQEKTLRKEYEGLLKKRCKSYEKLKKEVGEQLQLQQKLGDNLLANFLVGFMIMILICMVPITLLASE